MEKRNVRQIELNISLKLIAKSSLIVLFGVIISKVLAYIYRIIIARYFGPEVYGLFSLALMVCSLFCAISLMGLSDGLLRYISLYRGKKQISKIAYILKITLFFSFISGLLFSIILFFSSNFISVTIFHNLNLVIYLKIFSILVLSSSLLSLYLSVLRAFEEIGWFSFIFNILQNVSKLLFILFFILLGLKVNAVILSHFFSVLVMLLTAYLVCKYKISKVFTKKYTLDKKIKIKMAKELMSYSWPIMFFGVISVISYWTDSFAIGYFRTATEVGFYNAAVPIAALLGFAPDLFMQLFFPLINKEYAKKNIALIKQLSQQVGKWIFILNLPLFLVLIVFPGTIINFLFGQEYLVAENTLRFLAIGSLFFCLSPISSSLISMIGKSKLIFLSTLFSSVLNIILNIALVPKYGINGAAFSTMLCFILLSFLFLFEANYYTSIIPLRRKMFRILIISIIPLMLLILIKQFISINLSTLFFLGFFFILTYTLLIFLTHCLDENDFMIIKTIRKRLLKTRLE